MIANCPSCAPAAPHVRGRGRARTKRLGLGLVPAILYALVPKCPFCLAAYFSAFGVTVGTASVMLSVLGALAMTSMVLALGLSVLGLRRRAVHARGRVEAPPSIVTTTPLMYDARADAR
jgi:hypothetical protein